MKIALRPADRPGDGELMATLDAQMFGPTDAYTAADFEGSLCWILEIDGVPSGSVALGEHIGLDENADEVPLQGSLYVTTTGVLPQWQGRGLGAYLKAFEVAYARVNSFSQIVTVCRSRNLPILRVNVHAGFRFRSRVADMYREPSDDGLILALDLKGPTTVR